MFTVVVDTDGCFHIIVGVPASEPWAITKIGPQAMQKIRSFSVTSAAVVEHCCLLSDLESRWVNWRSVLNPGQQSSMSLNAASFSAELLG